MLRTSTRKLRLLNGWVWGNGWLRSLFAAGLLAGLLGGLVVSLDWYAAEPPEALAQAKYVGRQACVACHQAECDAYAGSHHDRAMELATEESVLGDFDNAVLERMGLTTRFFRRDGDYYVNTEGPDGELHDYRVKYTFGYEPLQQYMVEFPDGRVQVLRESWNTELGEWFYVPPPDAVDERLAPDDPTHWTGIAQNWNSTCAQCHSTDLKKNYDLETDTFRTTFSEIDVSCEACHGPASLHVKLAESRSLFWDRRHGYGLGELKGFDNRAEVDTCAQCHSRQTGRFDEAFRPGDLYADHYDLALLHDGFYHADGQMDDEVFVHGSFLQSKMYAHEVRCSNCHDPHSLELRFKGNQLCAQCHVPAKYDTPAHHHHPMGTSGAQCVECHMPSRTYMVVDERRDHSLRVPRPDLSVLLDTPNACNDCHSKPAETPEWAAAKVREWYGPRRVDDPHWASALAAGRGGSPEGEALLLEVVKRRHTPAIVRATALELLSQYPTQPVVDAFRQALADDHALVRRAATAIPVGPPVLQRSLAPLLTDAVRGVRIAAARRLLNEDTRHLDREARAAFGRAVAEYEQQLRLTLELGAAHEQLAGIAMLRGNRTEAQGELRTAIRLAPYRSGARGELARLLSQGGGEPEEIESLRREELELAKRDIELQPEDAALRFRAGMLHYMLGEAMAAEQRMVEAHELAPHRWEYLILVAELQLKRYATTASETAYQDTLASLQTLHGLDPTSEEPARMLRQLQQIRKMHLEQGANADE